MTFTKILVATDFSRPAERAVALGHAWAERSDAHITYAHIYDPAPLNPIITYPTAVWTDASLGEELRREADKSMATVLGEYGGARADSVVLAARDAAGSLTDYAEENEVDLIVIGSHGRTGLARFLLGSVAEVVVRRAPCPVLVSRFAGDAQTFPRRMHVCTDLSPAAADGVRLAAEVAKTLGGSAELVHAEDPRHEELDADVHRSVLRELTEQLEALHRAHFEGDPRATIVSGFSAADAITTHAQRTEPDLIVLATHGRTGLARIVMGSVAERVTRHATCSVLVARSALDSTS